MIERGNQYVSLLYQEAKCRGIILIRNFKKKNLDYTKLIAFLNTEDKLNLACGVTVRGELGSKKFEFKKSEESQRSIT